MEPTIVIVGGGFCGVALAHGLASLSWPGGVRIVVAEKSGRFGRGAAYSTDHPAHLLNVPAGRMGALAEDEGHFLRWLRETDASMTGDAFVPRSRYGDYLEHVFDRARSTASRDVRIDARSDRVVGVDVTPSRLRVKFESGTEMPTDRLVLAIGNLPPRDLSGITPAFRNDAAYVQDPWKPDALNRIARATSVVLVGTGLTMIDAVLALHDSTPEATFIAVSRHGLLPQSHRDKSTRPAGIRPSHELDVWNGSASGLFRIVRDEARAAERAGLDWRDVINGLRPVTPALWRRMPAREQARFHRHIRPYWDSHRHRMSTRVALVVDDLMASKQLSIVAGRIAACARDGDRVAVEVRGRDGETIRHAADAVVNCTGPCSDFTAVEDPLVAGLRASGDIVPDGLGIGIQSGDDGAVIGRDGRASATIYTLGGTRRPALWESTAVPELREQAAALAQRLHLSLNPSG